MLRIHFLNVGHGDCAIVAHPSGRLTVIDINNAQDYDSESLVELLSECKVKADAQFGASLKGTSRTALLKEAGYSISLTDPIEFLKINYPKQPVFRFIQTHPDLDHMRGIRRLAEEVGIINFWDTAHQKTSIEYKNESDKVDWLHYQAIRAKKDNPRVLQLAHGSTGAFFNEEPAGVSGGDHIEVLYPTPTAMRALRAVPQDKLNTNNLSYILRVTSHGISIIFGGDAEKEAWEEVVALHGISLKCDVLKASHHGRDTGYYQEAVKLMSPKYTIVSVGKKPDTDASNKYRQYSANVWSTRWKGDIELTVDAQGKGTISSQY